MKPIKPKTDKERALTTVTLETQPRELLTDVREMILSARQTVATTANATLTMLHWQIGNRIRKDILREKRAEYGEQILSTLSQKLEAEFGRGFGRRNLFSMVRFAEVFPDMKIVQSLIAQLGWTHFLHLIGLDDPPTRVASPFQRIGPRCSRKGNWRENSMTRCGWREPDCRPSMARVERWMNSFVHTRTEKPGNSEDSMDNHRARLSIELSIEGRDRVPQVVQNPLFGKRCPPFVGARDLDRRFGR
jgi:DUF1016 N-terminal domain